MLHGPFWGGSKPALQQNPLPRPSRVEGRGRRDGFHLSALQVVSSGVLPLVPRDRPLVGTRLDPSPLRGCGILPQFGGGPASLGARIEEGYSSIRSLTRSEFP